MDAMIPVIFAFLIGLVLFVALRGLVLWYFRIPELIEVMREIRDRLPQPKNQAPVRASDDAPGALEKWAQKLLRV